MNGSVRQFRSLRVMRIGCFLVKCLKCDGIVGLVGSLMWLVVRIIFWMCLIVVIIFFGVSFLGCRFGFVQQNYLLFLFGLKQMFVVCLFFCCILISCVVDFIVLLFVRKCDDYFLFLVMMLKFLRVGGLGRIVLCWKWQMKLRRLLFVVVV